MTTLHEAGQACNNCGTAITPSAPGEAATPAVPVLTVDEHVAVELAEEIALAEYGAGNGPDEDSTLAGILAYALIPSGGSLVAGLMQMVERQLFAASLVSKGGHLDASAMDDGHRLILAAIEIDRREREGRAAAAKAAKVAP